MISLAIGVGSAAAADIAFSGSSYEIIKVTPEKNTGLDMIYVAYDASKLTEMRISGISSSLKVSKYSNLGGGYAQEMTVSWDGNVALVANPGGDLGYIIEDQGKSTYIWLVDYLPHRFELQSAYADAMQDCDNTRVAVDGSGPAIHYFSIDGRQCELSRDIQVEYSTLEWKDAEENYVQKDLSKTLPHLPEVISVTPPIYCNSVFAISGDRFLKQWKMEEKIESSLVHANGVAVHTDAEQTNLPEQGEESVASNVIRSDVEGIGGSAPCDVSFKAWTTDAVVHNEWQISTDAEFENIDYRFNEQNLDYTFTDEGTYYIRFVGSNSDGTCEAVGETYTVGIGSSELRIPNAFTPNGDGINDVWKVAYRSLLSFSCSIFDRYGTELYHFTDPSDGWDGKYKGKAVQPGVYFYVIEAKGADGKKYKKGGDINIIKAKNYSGSVSGDSGAVTQ